MKKLIAAIAVVAIASAANAQGLVGEYSPEGGPITVTAVGDIAAAGIDFNSAGGNLVPDPDGDTGPFAFYLSNTANQITLGNLGSDWELADGASYTFSFGAAAGADDIVASWGSGSEPVAFPVEPTPPPGNEVIPEPASGTLLVLAGIIGLAFRRRR